MSADNDLATAIAETSALHAECLEKFGTETPEDHDSIPEGLRTKMRLARTNANAALSGCTPAEHVRHLQALCCGLRLVMCRLGDDSW
jgi:hypothetical protein